MTRRSKATGSGRDPSRQRNSTSTTGVVHPVREDPHNRAMLAAVGVTVADAPLVGGTRDLVFESEHEKDCLVVLDVSPGVERLETQPQTWRLASGRRYTPDIRADGDAIGTVFVEVKPARILARDPSLAGRRADIEAEALAREARFEVMSEGAYRDVRLHNAHVLRNAARWDLPAGRERVLEEMRARPAGATLLELVLALRMGVVGKFAVLGLVALGILRIDQAELIGPDTRIRWREELDG